MGSPKLSEGWGLVGFVLAFLGVLAVAGIIGGYRSWGGPTYGGSPGPPVLREA